MLNQVNMQNHHQSHTACSTADSLLDHQRPPVAECQTVCYMIWQVRHGQGDEAVELLARECGRPLPDIAGVRPTQLFAR